MLWVWCRAEPQQQDLLQQALAAEMAKAARRSGQDVSKGSQVQFKQVMLVHSQACCQWVDYELPLTTKLHGNCTTFTSSAAVSQWQLMLACLRILESHCMVLQKPDPEELLVSGALGQQQPITHVCPLSIVCPALT